MRPRISFALVQVATLRTGVRAQRDCDPSCWAPPNCGLRCTDSLRLYVFLKALFHVAPDVRSLFESPEPWVRVVWRNQLQFLSSRAGEQPTIHTTHIEMCVEEARSKAPPLRSWVEPVPGKRSHCTADQRHAHCLKSESENSLFQIRTKGYGPSFFEEAELSNFFKK